MKDRILEFLQSANKSSALFAEEIGVQPSSVSHILSGRNRPSLDFVLKMLERYKSISTEWLLFGKGKMFKESVMPTLFDEIEMSGKIETREMKTEMSGQEEQPIEKEEVKATVQTEPGQNSPCREEEIDKIVWFYKDKSFSVFSPR